MFFSLFETLSAICWAVVLARLIEVAHNITAVNPLSFIQISIQDLVSKIKTKEEDKEITSLKRVFKVISHPGIKKVPTTRHVSTYLSEI